MPSIVPALVLIRTVHRVRPRRRFLMIVGAAAARFAVVVLRTAKAVAETVGADDPSVGVVACVGDEVGTAVGRWAFVGGDELFEIILCRTPTISTMASAAPSTAIGPPWMK